MVGCDYSVGQNAACLGGKPVANVFLYPVELHVMDNELAKIQIITNAQACDNSEQVPIEYCLDWGDGSAPSSGSFTKGKPANVELSHTFRFGGSDKYTSTKYLPKVTIKTGCGGIRTVGDNIGICVVYAHQVGDVIPDSYPSMRNYKLYDDFNANECGSGLFVPQCTTGQSKCEGGVTLICDDGNWSLSPIVCTDPNGVKQEIDPSVWTSVLYTSITPSNTLVEQEQVTPTTTGGGNVIGDIASKIQSIANEHKLMAVCGIALIGGLILFGGKRRKRDEL